MSEPMAPGTVTNRFWLSQVTHNLSICNKNCKGEDALVLPPIIGAEGIFPKSCSELFAFNRAQLSRAMDAWNVLCTYPDPTLFQLRFLLASSMGIYFDYANGIYYRTLNSEEEKVEGVNIWTCLAKKEEARESDVVAEEQGGKEKKKKRKSKGKKQDEGDKENERLGVGTVAKRTRSADRMGQDEVREGS